MHLCNSCVNRSAVLINLADGLAALSRIVGKKGHVRVVLMIDEDSRFVPFGPGARESVLFDDTPGNLAPLSRATHELSFDNCDVTVIGPRIDSPEGQENGQQSAH